MNKEHVKSAGNKIAGKAKEEVGELMNDKSLELKGKAQQTKAEVQKALGDAKDTLNK